jgi:hypothetical protein
MRSRRPYAGCASSGSRRGVRERPTGATIPIRPIGRYLLAALLAVTAALSGCASIHSEAVRQLIDRQASKTQEASQASKAFIEQTQGRVDAYNQGVSDLNTALLGLRKQESVLALALASSQPVATKTGIDARAFGYQAGLLYLDTQAGLDQAVNKQFQEDFAAMETLSQQISASWDSLEKLQTELTRYSQQSSVASADQALVAAVLEQAHVSPQNVADVVQRSKQVNKALEKASGFGVLQGEQAGKARGYLQDLIELLDSTKKP